MNLYLYRIYEILTSIFPSMLINSVFTDVHVSTALKFLLDALIFLSIFLFVGQASSDTHWVASLIFWGLSLSPVASVEKEAK